MRRRRCSRWPPSRSPAPPYTGAGLGYKGADILGGALPPLVAAALVAAGNSLGVGIMLSLLSAVSMLRVVAMTESSENVKHADAELTEDRVLATEVP